MRRPNVILCVFDALRPDFLSCYGENFARVTPAFDKAAQKGTQFTNAFSAARYTPPSHGTMFTGKYPSETGLLGGHRAVPDDVDTVAEFFRSHGYETFAVSRRRGMLNSDLDHDRGFDEFFEPDREDAVPSTDINYFKNLFDTTYLKEFVRFLHRGRDDLTRFKFDVLADKVKKSEEPFFSFINQLTTHVPYRPPRPYLRQNVASAERPRLHLTELLKERMGVDEQSIVHPGAEREDNNFWYAYVAESRDHNYDDREFLSAEEMSIVRNLYGAEVEYLDSELERFIDQVIESGKFENTIFVLTADHGELLGERSVFGHGHGLHDELLHVPLIVMGPGVPEGEVRDDLVSLVDLFDTLSDLCGLPSPTGTSGRSMFGGEPRDAVFAEDGIDAPREEDYPDTEPETIEEITAGKKCIRTADYKLTITSSGDTRVERTTTTEEPATVEGEERDEVIDRFRPKLTRILGTEFSEKKQLDEAQVDQEVLDNLDELGYI